MSKNSTPASWRRRLAKWLALIDAVVIAVSTVSAYLVRLWLAEAGVLREFNQVVPAAVAVLPLWLAIFYFVGAYRPEYLNTGADSFRRFVAGVVGGVLALGFVSFILRLLLPRVYVALLAVFVFLLGAAARLALRSYVQRRQGSGQFTQGFLVVGVDPEAIAIARSLASDPLTGYVPRGYLTSELAVGTNVDGVNEVVGRPEDVVEKARQLHAGLVLVAPAGLPPGTLKNMTVALEGSEIDLAVAPSFFEVVSRRVVVETVGNVPILHVQQIRLTQGKAILKRSLDLAVAGLAAVLTLPVLAVTWVVIRSTSPGPAIFRQRRIGLDGSYFTVYKFRTMYEDAEQRLQDLRDLNQVGGADDIFFKVEDDPRVTPAGRFLRKWSIDELPQLWNVLRGDMSMVGPRPLPVSAEQFEPWQLRRLRVRPGLTGVWQVSGRSYVDTEDAVRMDIFYIENWSLGWDLLILLQTIGAVLRREGAH